jgi:outer membrane protein OmpA-like peptidoglycan-associated protein
MIEGHTDSTGSADYNLGLSLRRAESIRDALIASGVGEERLLAAGYGSRFPVADNETDEGRARNRRVEIVILKPGLKASDAGL